jgi:putative DNA primase/helicase
MSTDNTHGLNKLSTNPQDKDNLKKLIIDEVTKLTNSMEPIQKTTDDILQELLKTIGPIDFKLLAFPESEEVQKQFNALESILLKGGELSENQQFESDKLSKKLKTFKLIKKHYLIICIEQVIAIAEANKWGLCKNNGFIYLFNGCYWIEIGKESFQSFLGKVALKMGVEKFEGKIHTFREDLFKQYMADSYLETPKGKKNCVLINYLNGTLEITPTDRIFREFRQEDFLRHQLPFEYDPKATAPMWQKFLNEVLPDQDKQKVLAEYFGYIFIKPSVLKLEKMLILYGTGANGKSVVFEVFNAILGNMISNYSLQRLTDGSGYYRAKIGNMLANYASEINGKLETDIFKQMASGEPIEARLPYGDPFILTEYAKLIFNCNELPKDVEHTNAYFRRFLIILFNVTIPEDKQDKQLPQKIIRSELSGVFNWILQGLDRVMEQKNFSKCEAVDNARIDYEMQSDSVQLFINEMGYKTSTTQYVLISELHPKYKMFCNEDGYIPVGKAKFIQRLRHYKIFVNHINKGNVAYLSN